MDLFLQFFVTGLTTGSIYALVALGFTIIYNASDVVNFAQGEFLMMGAMSAIFIHKAGIPLVLAVAAGVLVSTAAGLLLERLAIEPARDASVVSLIIITIGASIFFRGVALLVWGKEIYGLPPFSGDRPLELMGATILPQSIWVVAGTALLVALVKYFFDHTLTGKAMRACSHNRRAAALLGIDVRRIMLISYGLSAALGGIAGVLIAPITYMTYDAGVMLGLKGFCAAILGGMGNSMGAVAGGLLLGLIEALGTGFISSGYKDAISFFLILLILFFRPSGLFGRGGGERV